MREFCTAHGEGKKWYLEMKNYAGELLHQELSAEQKEIVGTSTRLEWTRRFFEQFTIPAATGVPAPLGFMSGRPAYCAPRNWGRKEAMNRKWIVVLPLIVLSSVLACSFSIDLGPSPDTPEPVATTAPASEQDVDPPYVSCAREIMLDWVELTGDVGDGMEQFVQDPGEDWSAKHLFCDERRPQYWRRLEEIEQRHSECPLPQDTHSSAARRHIENGLSDLEAAIGWYEKYCDEWLNWVGDPLPYDQGNDRLQESFDSADRAAEQLDQYNR